MCRQILKADPRYPEAWTLRAMIANDLDDPQAALGHIERALASAPGVATYHSNRGAVLQKLDRPAEAETAFLEAIRLAPAQSEFHNSLGNVYLDLKRPADAEASYRRALELRPDYADAHYHLGNLLGDTAGPGERNRLAESEKILRRAIELKPDLPEAYNSLGKTMMVQGRIDQAEAFFRRALELKPAAADFNGNLAVLQLLKGDYEQGWKQYEWRWKTRGYRLPPYSQPAWDGSPLDGRTILLHPEQGYGDLFQFIRYAPLVKERGGTVLFHCPRAVLDLVAHLPRHRPARSRGAPLPAFDWYAPLASLPRHFGTTLATVPARVPYLFADAALVERWRRRVAPAGGLKIGIVWQGSPRDTGDISRSVPLGEFAPLARVAGVNLFSLQVLAGHEQLQGLGGRFPVTDLGGEFDVETFNDAAAAVQSLDLVVCVDTALAHLAGALGKPVWLALALTPDWRWLLEREDSPWYPTVRLFRQSRSGEWAGVFARLAEAVAQRVSS